MERGREGREKARKREVLIENERKQGVSERERGKKRIEQRIWDREALEREKENRKREDWIGNERTKAEIDR